jgi:hypothetical protein
VLVVVLELAVVLELIAEEEGEHHRPILSSLLFGNVEQLSSWVV